MLIVPERRAALDALAIHATTLRIPVVEVEGGTLTALAGFDGHQGVALVARPRPAGDVDAILARAHERGEAPFVLVLDSLEDPQNFGTLLRSAEACGVHGVIYPTRRSAPLSPAAIKASAGATEHLVLAAVDDLAGTLADLHGTGLRLVGADEKAPLAYGDADLRGPLAIIVGSEGQGISGPVHRRLDLVVRIPMRGKIGSLNAAVAGSILLFAAAAQRPESAPRTEAVAPEPRVESPAEDSEQQKKSVAKKPAPARKSAATKAPATAKVSVAATKPTAKVSAAATKPTAAKPTATEKSKLAKAPATAKKSTATKTSAPAKKASAKASAPAKKASAKASTPTKASAKASTSTKASTKRSRAAEEDLLPGDG